MLDFYNIDSQLSEEERAIRDSVRAFVNERVLPIIGQAYVDGRFPREIIPEMAELGVFGANLPEEYGCAGLNNVAYGLINQELERGDSGVRSFASVQSSLAMYPIYAFGSEEQKKKWLPRMAKAEVIGCFGLTEPDFGSNPSGMISMAPRCGSRTARRRTSRSCGQRPTAIQAMHRFAASSSRPTAKASRRRIR